MSPLAIVYFLAFLFHSYLALLVVARNPRNRLNWIGAAVVGCFALWSFMDIFDTILSLPVATVRLLDHIGGLGWCSFSSMFLLFVIHLTTHGRRVRITWPSLSLVLLPWFFIYALWTGRLIGSYHAGPANWISEWTGSWWTWTFYAYYVLTAFGACVLLLVHRRRAGTDAERRQAGILAVTAVIALVLGTFTNVVSPQLHGSTVPELANVLAAIWSAGLYVAVTRYGMFSMTPQVAADGILAAMQDGVLLLDPEYRIVTANQAALDLFGYLRSELVGQFAGLLVADPARFREILGGITGRGPVEHISFDCRTKSGRALPVSISGRAMYDDRRGPPNALVGIVLVLRNITEQRRSEEELRQAHDRMELKVLQRTVELSETNKALQIEVVERKRAQEEVARLQQQIEFVLGVTKTGLDIIDADHNVRYIDPPWQGEYGSPAGKKCYEYFCDRTEVCPDCGVTRALQTRQVVITEHSLSRAPGRIFRVATSPIQNEQGEWLGAEVATEITDLKHAEEKLRESERRYRELTDSLPQPVFEMDARGKLTFVNPSALEVFGYSREDFDRGLNVLDVIAPDDQDWARANIERVLSGAHLGGIEYRIVRKDGSQVPVIAHTSRIMLEGRPIGIRGVAFDVSELKRVERALRRQRGRAQEYLDVAGVVILATDTEGRVTLINRKGCETIGAREGEIIGRNIFESYVPERNRAAMQARLREMLSGAPAASEYAESPLLTASGEERVIAWHTTILNDSHGTPVGTLNSGTDITEQKRAEVTLRSSEEKYRQVVENANEMILVAQDGRLKFTNPRVTAVLGYSREELLDRPFVELIHPEDSSTVAERHRRRTAGEILPSVYSFRIIAKDGSIRWLEINAVKTEWEGRPATLNFLNDITDRKRIEEELDFHRRKLEDLVQERTRELAAAQEALVREQRLAALGWIAGQVAHEISNPLGAIGNAAYFLKNALGRELDPQPATQLEVIENETARAHEIIVGLLGFSQGQPPTPGFYSLDEILVEATEKTAVPPGVSLNLRVPDNIPALRVDYSQVVQAFVKLFAYSLRAMNGQGVITIQAREQEASREERAVSDECRRLVVSLSASGPGVPADMLAHLFEPIFSTKTFGIGLGLSISKSYIEANHGTIEARSEPGKGVTFFITLPTAE
jgi:PAS domain S-box-containing protein